MCGITGIHSSGGNGLANELISAMTGALAHRGPDGEGTWSDEGIALGHRRLSIVDLSARGRQPMTNEDGSLRLTYNGEIYNHAALRRELEQRGHRFSSSTDSEVLLHLYEEADGDLEKWLAPVRGMFAVGLWDARRRRLVVARDRIGIKPLYYYEGDRFTAFASELDALIAHPGVPRRVDWTSVFEYLHLLVVPEPHTIYRDIRALPPGTAMVVDERGSRLERYWSLSGRDAESLTSEAEADEALEAELAETIQLHLLADVEVGAFLSGGIDSSLVTAIAMENSAAPVRTFSATFPNEDVDEGPWARETAEVLGTRHTEFSVTRGFLDRVDEITWRMDQPLALSSGVSLFHLAARAREHVKVVLTGDGGDELFGGYPRHGAFPKLPYRLDRVSFDMRRKLAGVASHAAGVLPSRGGVSQRAMTLSRVLRRDEADLYAPRVAAADPVQALSLLAPEVAQSVDTRRYTDRLRRLFAESPFEAPLARRLHVDLQSSLVDEMLAKVDRMTMASGLEARVPLLDHRVVELATRIASPLKRAGDEGKRPLRRLVSRRLGSGVGTRAKRGFNSPLPSWLRSEPETKTQAERLWTAVRRLEGFDPEGVAAVKASAEAASSESVSAAFALMVFGSWASQRSVSLA